ncbi:MAG: V-type ATP synthase subunit E [Lachnospiraceae bacterium]|nr:V-type ATP synthase subunit E [Lachnospiraceae bacterium]
MTLEEKIDFFKNSAMADATKKSQEKIENYETAIKQQYEDYVKEAKSKSEEELEKKKNALEKELNQKLTKESLDSKRLVSNKSSELTNKIFDAVSDKIKAYRKTDAYIDTLIKYINKAKDFAGDNEYTIYIDPDDKGLKEKLEAKTKTKLELNETSFGGGIKAVIPDKNVLIDESFDSKLSIEKEKFSL